jgi:hypothetical protein
MSFAATDRIATRLTIPDWPHDDVDELTSAIHALATFELANDLPAVVEDGSTAHLAWRGYLTGGLLTLFERLGDMISERGLGAFYADPRLEVFVPAAGDVVVMGALRHPIVMPRPEWNQRVATADSGDDLAAGFVHDALSGASEVLAAARESAERNLHHIGAPPPDAYPQHMPGEVDFDLLDDADCVLTEAYDPEDVLDGSWLSCQLLRWRTDFVAPGTQESSHDELKTRGRWRVVQWEWVPDPDAEADDVEDGEGDWALRGHMTISARDVTSHIPAPLAEWVRRMTAAGIEWASELAELEPALLETAEQLRHELADLT